LVAGNADQTRAIYDDVPTGFFNSVDSLAEIFSIQLRLSRLEAALDTTKKLAALGHDIGALLSRLANTAAHHCAWPVRDRLEVLLRQRARAGGACVIELFPVFAMTDDTELHCRLAGMISAAISGQHAASARRQRAGAVAKFRHSASRRLRIAYLGGNFSRHATALLLSGVIEQHDGDRCEIMLFDYSVEDGSDARSRVLRAFDRVEILGNAGPRASADRIRREKPDILIDVHGYAARKRSEILAYTARSKPLCH
jgi:predicted O-linked N-acetylglucosamine transferase (SPINDLY family)